MKKQKIDKQWIEACHRISDALFEMSSHPYAESDVTIRELIAEVSGIEILDGKLYDRICDFLWKAEDIAFGIGFTLGQTLDLPYSKAKEDIELVKKVIREKGLVSHLPREKKKTA